MDKLQTEYVRYFAQDSLQLVLNMNGHFWLPRRQYFEHDLRVRKIFFLDYVTPFVRAVGAAASAFERQVKTECDIWKIAVCNTSESARKEKIFEILSNYKLSLDKQDMHHESLFIVMATAGELCARCFLDRQDVLSDVEISVTVFLMTLMKKESLKIKECTSTFLQMHGNLRSID